MPSAFFLKSKTNDMDTSLIAYENKKPTIPNDHELILSVMDNDIALTYKEIGYLVYKKLLLDSKTRLNAFAWKYDPNKVSRRLKELVLAKKIEIKEQRKCTRAKSMCNSYLLL